MLHRRILCRFSFRPIFIVLLALSLGGVFILKEYDDSVSVSQKYNENFKDFEAPRKPDKEEHLDVGRESKKKRENLIIVTHGRSGSTFIGNIFNHHPNVFYLFEPYQTVERLHGAVATGDRDYQGKAFEWMKGILQCDFVSTKHVQDLERYYRRRYRKNYNPIKSISLLSPPFCPYNTTHSSWSAESCPPMDKETLEATCKSKYNITVLKPLIGRMPNENVKQLLSVCDNDRINCKFLFLVRDPRGIIPSSRAFGFFKDDDDSLLGTHEWSKKICSSTEINLNFFRSMSSDEKKRFMLLRYEDLAKDPLKTLPSLLKFAGLPDDKNLRKWLDLASHRPETESERNAARWRQDSWEGAERWRWLVESDVISVIEKYCSHVMSVLGYKAVGGSHDLQTNLAVKLLEDSYEALRWF